MSGLLLIPPFSTIIGGAACIGALPSFIAAKRINSANEFDSNDEIVQEGGNQERTCEKVSRIIGDLFQKSSVLLGLYSGCIVGIQIAQQFLPPNPIISSEIYRALAYQGLACSTAAIASILIHLGNQTNRTYKSSPDAEKKRVERRKKEQEARDAAQKQQEEQARLQEIHALKKSLEFHETKVQSIRTRLKKLQPTPHRTSNKPRGYRELQSLTK